VRAGGGTERWKYKIADLTKIEKDAGELNRLGAEGPEATGHRSAGPRRLREWEAVGMVSTWGSAGWRFVHPIAAEAAGSTGLTSGQRERRPLSDPRA